MSDAVDHPIKTHTDLFSCGVSGSDSGRGEQLEADVATSTIVVDQASVVGGAATPRH